VIKLCCLCFFKFLCLGSFSHSRLSHQFVLLPRPKLVPVDYLVKVCFLFFAARCQQSCMRFFFAATCLYLHLPEYHVCLALGIEQRCCTACTAHGSTCWMQPHMMLVGEGGMY
jgi:hypothetical protein